MQFKVDKNLIFPSLLPYTMPFSVISDHVDERQFTNLLSNLSLIMSVLRACRVSFVEQLIKLHQLVFFNSSTHTHTKSIGSSEMFHDFHYFYLLLSDFFECCHNYEGFQSFF